MKDSSGRTTLLTLQDTFFLKGLAIIMMLIHHLFWVQNGLFDDIQLYGKHYLVNEIGIFSKLCVVLFVFLSGYGLTVQAEQRGGVGELKRFYIKRLKKLYLNYWFIWIAFVPISVLSFGISFQDVYQSNVSLHLVLDLLGIHRLIYHDILCYNPTWWFYSCIIVLYLLFPLMYKMMKKDALSLILLSLIISFLPIDFIDIIKFNIVAFSLGMWMVTYKNAPPHFPARYMDYIIAGPAICSGEKYQQLSIDDRLYTGSAYSKVISIN